MTPGLCRDCLVWLDDATTVDRCPACRSRRIVAHPELGSLTLAHIDCDAFYATVEKRDDPTIRDRPVIVGGGRRGVVSAACYIARRYGVHSAMPMFKALQLCPDAVVIPPDMAKYAAVSRQVRAIFLAATPLVEPIALDEAFLDLTGTEQVHRRPAAATLADIARRVEHEIGITVSIGLSHTKFLAKLASEIDKPRGFGVIGRAEARGFLASRSVRVIPGVGPKTAARLSADGIERIADLQALGAIELERRYGEIGRRLAELSEGRDAREVVPDRDAKGISAETTFEMDLAGAAALKKELWPLCERVADRLKAAGLSGPTVVLKLKTADFRLITRRTTLSSPTQLAETIWRAAVPMLEATIGNRRFRLLGVGVTGLVAAGPSTLELFGDDTARIERVERTIDRIRAKFGREAIGKGRGLTREVSRRPATTGGPPPRGRDRT